MTSAINNNQALLDSLGLSAPAPASTQRNEELGADQFMELMLAQIKNQDPLKPMENGEFLAQIAQFSTVTGVNDLNQAFAEFSGSMLSNQALQASSMVGRTVLVNSDQAPLAAGGRVDGTIDLPATSNDLTVGVYDAAGQLVRTLHLGQQTAGEVAFSWDGLGDDGAALPAGTYTIKAETKLDDEAVALETYVYDQVQSVDLGGGRGIRLNLAGLGTADFSDVRQIM
jgi:flagellar basal-body rod modification protein FlgD